MDQDKLIKPGIYHGKISNYGVGKTKAGDPQMVIGFSISAGDQSHNLVWYGSFKEGKAREITINTLLYCGLSGNDLAGLADGLKSGLLDTDRELLLTVEHEENDKGKMIPRVKWVNLPGGRAFSDLMTKSEANGFLGSLKGDLIAQREKTGLKAKGDVKNMAPKARNPAGDDNDDIPF